MQRASRTRAALLLLGCGMGGLAACTTIIGIDDSLPGPDDASVDAVAPGTDGDATAHGDATLPVDGGIVADSATADVEVTRTITFIRQQEAVAISPLGALVGSDLRFGEALALSPTGVLAIGAPGAGRPDSDAGATGQVQLVTMSLNADNSGSLSVELLNPGQGVTSAPVAGGAFGGAVAFSPDGHYLAVGAPAEPHPPSLTTGNVYLYQAQNGGWSYVGTFQPPPGAAPSFGRTVALTDNVLYIAATGDATEGDAGTSVARASVNAYTLVDGGFVPYRTATSPQLHDGFGWSLAVSLDNHFVAIGAPFGNVNDDSQDGLVYLAPLGNFGGFADFATPFVPTDSTNGGAGSSALFGYSLATTLDKSQIYIGAPGVAGAAGGDVRLWDVDGGTDVLTTGPAYVPDPRSPTERSRFGLCVVASTTAVVVGAPAADAGTCWTWPLPGGGSPQPTELTADSELSLEAGARYGAKLATAGSGAWVAVAAPGTNGTPAPVVYLTR